MNDWRFQGIGWFVRRTTDPSVLTRFYNGALGLTVLREWDTENDKGGMLWAGRHSVLETNVLTLSDGGTPEPARCVPVFATYDPTDLGSRLQSLKVQAKDDQPVDGITFYDDPDEVPFAITSTPPPEGARATLPGVDAPLCVLESVLHLTPISTEDAADTYADILGVSRAGGAAIDVGDGQSVGFQPSGLGDWNPTDRKQAVSVWILRVYGFNLLEQACETAGLKVLNALRFKGGRLNYYLDSGGGLFGFQERFAANPALPTTQLIEDVSAREAIGASDPLWTPRGDG